MKNSRMFVSNLKTMLNMKGKCFYLSALIFVLFAQIGFAQQKSITGTVTDSDGVPLLGATVLVKGTTTGASTDFDGNYTLTAEVGSTLEFSYVGYETVTRVVGASSTYNVSLELASNIIDEVVLVGYGVQRKSEVTGAISQVKGEDVRNLVTPSFESQLAGRSSGVQITSGGGVIGEAPRVNIRGVASINSGTGPLYVVDGVPYTSSQQGANMAVNPLADLNPNDIESFEVLKDGAASAIYGSRAANGVILITTRTGRKNSFEVNYSSLTGLASPMNEYNLLGAKDFVTISNEKTGNRGASDWAAGTEYDTDWQDLIFRSSALQVDQNINVSGGSDNATYYLSLGYGTQEGNSIANEMEKYNIRARVEQDFNKWLSAGASVAVTRNNVSAMNKGSNSLSGHIFNATKQLPNVPVYDPNNETGYNISETGQIGRWDNLENVGAQLPNIMFPLEHNYYKSKTTRNVVNMFADAKILDGLTYRFQLGLDYGTNGERMYWNPIHGDGAGHKGLMQQFSFENQLWNIQNILSYNKTFNEVHNLGLTGVAEFQEQKYAYFYTTGRDLASDYFNEQIITDAFGVQEIGGYKEAQGIKSFIGRATYNYDQRYFLQASIRRDGISNLDPANRWDNFLGVSAGWTISNEEFWDKDGTVNDLKLRGSYAQTGNTNIGAYPYMGIYGLNKYGDDTGYGYTQFGNNNLVWESTNKLNVGLDLGLWNSRVFISAEYFKNETKDMIINKSTAPSLGVPGNIIKINAGDMENSGVEFSVDATVVNTDDFRWDTGANISFSKNKVSNLPDGADIFPEYSTNASINGNIIIRDGEAINSLYGYEYWGVNPANGAPVYHKADGTLVQVDYNTGSYYVFDEANPGDMSQASSLSSSEDRKILGQTTPKYFGGWHNTMSYKNFDLSFLFRFSGGNKIFNYTRRELLSQTFNNNLNEIMGRWQSPDNPGDGVTPKLWANGDGVVNNNVLSSRFAEKGDFISLDNITLGYNFDRELLQRANIEALRVYVAAQNVFMITSYKGVDPEMITSYGVDAFGTPKSRIMSLGVNLKL